MNLNYKHLGIYLVAGIASGLLCHLIYTNHGLWKYVGPSLVLGLMIALAGRYISKITPRNPLLSPLILSLACGVGWFLAFQHGVTGGFYIGVIEAGIFGGFFVGIGLVVAWRLKRIWMIIMLTTLAGGLGALVLVLPELFGFDNFFPLFITWQGILLLGIGIAIQIDSPKSSIEE